jgi:RNA polymerase sigma-70 factor, ECF subfamily
MKRDSQTLQDLIAAAAHGDHGAFSQVYERTHAHLFGIAVRMLGHGHAAEDVLQEAFVSIWKNASSYKPSVDGQDAQPMAWLIAIVRNKALDALRVRTRRKESALPGEPEDGESEAPVAGGATPSAMELLEQATQAMHVDACMAMLDGTHRQSLALAYYQGLSHTEIAARMGAPLGSVKAWIRRGLDKLKDCLGGRGVMA